MCDLRGTPKMSEAEGVKLNPRLPLFPSFLYVSKGNTAGHRTNINAAWSTYLNRLDGERGKTQCRSGSGDIHSVMTD